MFLNQSITVADTKVKAYIRRRARDMKKSGRKINYCSITDAANNRYGTDLSRRSVTAYLTNQGLHNQR